MSTCDKCGHWEAERVRSFRPPRRGEEAAWQARCLADPAKAAPPLAWQWETCLKFAPESREHLPASEV